MTFLGRIVIAAGIAALPLSAHAESLPPLKLGAGNATPACATPGRIMAMLRDRNPALRAHFDKISVAYMKHGETLGVRWDYAMFQMIVETNSLKYTGDVDWNQNNFAGLAATGGGVKGERFATVSDGVKAHLEHLMIYAGLPVADPVADRTRKVQSWGILDKWRRSIRGPVTFAHIGRKWAPGDRGYARDIQTIANHFYGRYCNGADPNPELLAEARGARGLAPRTVATTQRGFERDTRSALGASAVPPALPSAQPPVAPRIGGNVKILNGAGQTDGGARTAGSGRDQRVASAAGAAGAAAKFAAPFVRPEQPLPDRKPRTSASLPKTNTPAASAPTKEAALPKADKPSCRVWTASYGGQKAIIIKSQADSRTNYTVLDVNEGREKREAAAYIAAYAKGGEEVGTFGSQTQALEKAFKLCPTG